MDKPLLAYNRDAGARATQHLLGVFLMIENNDFLNLIFLGGARFIVFLPVVTTANYPKVYILELNTFFLIRMRSLRLIDKVVNGELLHLM